MASIPDALAFIENSCQDGFFPCLLGRQRDLACAKPSPREIGSSLLVLGTVFRSTLERPASQATLQYALSYLRDGVYTFFEDPALLPADTETTAYGLTTLLECGAISMSLAKLSMERILASRNSRGIVQTYFVPCEKVNRTDHVSVVNVIRLFARLECEDQLLETQQWVAEMLETGQYLNGSRYYHSPSAFLYFLSSLLEFPSMRRRFEGPLRLALGDLSGNSTHPLDLAMRVTTARRLGVDNGESRLLDSMQQPGGSWPADAIFQLGSRIGYLGSSIISTALALEALS